MLIVDLGLGNGMGIMIITTNTIHVMFFLLLVFFPPSFVCFHFFFWEFIKRPCGLRWMCCGGDVAYYVECTNVVKKW